MVNPEEDRSLTSGWAETGFYHLKAGARWRILAYCFWSVTSYPRKFEPMKFVQEISK